MPNLLWTQRQDIGPSPRMNHAMAFASKSRLVVLHGGTGQDGVGWLDDTWEWDGELWTQKQDIGIGARGMHAIADDAAHGSLLAFGGFGADFLSDTWSWGEADEAWTQVADIGPSARKGMTLAYDSKRQRVVLFGGEDASGPLADTWEWDGDAWTQVADIGPPGRSEHVSAYDPVRGRTVVFGGTGKGGPLSDTWEWDGDDWVEIEDTGPGPCACAAAVFDGSVSLLFGGRVGAAKEANPSGRTWSFDGAVWRQRQDMGPSPRLGHALAFDPIRNRIVLFGGSTGEKPQHPVGDTWETSDAVADHTGAGDSVGVGEGSGKTGGAGDGVGQGTGKAAGAGNEGANPLGAVLTLDPATVGPLGQTRATIALAQPGAADIQFHLEVDGAALADPASLTIAAGEKSTTAWLNPLVKEGNYTITASSGATHTGADLQVDPYPAGLLASSLHLVPDPMTVGDQIMVGVTMSGKSPLHIGIEIREANAVWMIVPVLGDAQHNQVQVTPPFAPGDWTITTSLGGVEKSNVLHVVAKPPLLGGGLKPTPISHGPRGTGT